MSTVADLYDAYTAAASTPDGADRLARLRACAHESLTILSPFPYEARGVEAVSEQLGKVAAAMPDGRLTIKRTSPVDEHHGVFRVAFENVAGDGRRLSTGLHVVDVRDGLIERIVVFVPDALAAG